MREVPTRLGLVGGNSEEIALNVVRAIRTEMHVCHTEYAYTVKPVRELASRRPLCNLGARGAAAASECRRPVRSAAARRSARAEQRQDDVMTPAGPTDTTSAPSRASRCACVAGVVSLSTEQDDCSFYRACDTLLSESAR